MNSRPIGMFDSGVGGLTVYKDIRKLFPNDNIVYLGDTKNFPYGSKSKENIINYTKQGLDFLVSKGARAIVIACGTATSQALDIVKNLYSVPIIGMIEPTCDYISKSPNIASVGVLATEGSIKSESWQHFLSMYKPNLIVKSRACPLLAPMAEAGWTENEIARLCIREYLSNMTDVDALILGCTHYPLFINTFKAELPAHCEIINPAKFVAKSLKSILPDGNNSDPGNLDIYLTDLECSFVNVAKKILDKDLYSIKQISI